MARDPGVDVVESLDMARRPTHRKAEPKLDRATVLESLHSVAVAIGETTEAASLAALIGGRARELLGADDVSLYMWDSQAGLLQLVFEQNTGSALLPTMAASEGAVGRAFVSGEPQVVMDYPNWEGALPPLIKHGVRRMAAVPLRVGSRPVGVLAVRFLGPRGCQPAHVQALQILAAPVAGILEAAAARQRAEADRALLASIVDILRCGVMVRDTHSGVVLLNEAGRRFIGVAANEPTPTRYDQLEALEVRDPLTNRLLQPEESPSARALAGEAVVEYEARVRLRGAAESRWMRISAVPMYGGDATIVGSVSIFTDISPERALWSNLHASARENSRLVSELQEAQRYHQQMLDSLVSSGVESAGPGSLASRLTPRERQVLVRLARGETNRQIAAALERSPGTVRKHVEHILQKLGVGDRTRAAALASELGLVNHTH
jgi:DNA-binding CsgD family transcriptional regulator/PAS domain-containing protein